MTGRQPFVSVIMLTRDRPQFLSLALTCYARQTYAQRELIVVDDGGVHPADADAVAAAGGRLLRVGTAGLDGYEATRAFYERQGFTIAARIADFYWEGNDLVVYVKHFGN